MSSNRGIMYFLKDFATRFRVFIKIKFLDKEIFRQNSYIVIDIYSLVKVVSSGKKVCYCVTFACKMFKFKVVVLQEFSPSCLMRGNALSGSKLFQIVVIGSDQELVFGT